MKFKDMIRTINEKTSKLKHSSKKNEFVPLEQLKKDDPDAFNDRAKRHASRFF